MAAADEAELVHMVATAARSTTGRPRFRYPRGDGFGVPMPEHGMPLEIGKGRIVREGSTVACCRYGTRLQECMKAAEMLAAQGLSTTVADARFAKPLDTDLILRLARNHELLITIEEGAIGGFGAHVLQLLAEKGALEQPASRSARMVLPDVFIDQDSAGRDVCARRPRCERHRRQGVRGFGYRVRCAGSATGGSVLRTRAAARGSDPMRGLNGGLAMKVILAQPRGFCAGVVRAIEIVERALEKYGPPVYVRHEIVHNKWVVDALKARGARFVEDLSEVPPNGITIFSAHGVAKKVEHEAQERGLHVLNATCPLVSKVHTQGRHYLRKGRTVILIGHAGHPEVEGTLGQIPGDQCCWCRTKRKSTTLDLPSDTPVAYVTQTTLSVDDTKGIIAALYRKFTDVVGPGTRDICYATQNRQIGFARTEQAGGCDLRGRRGELIELQPAARNRAGSRHADLSDRQRRGDQAGMGRRRRGGRHHRGRIGAGSDGDGCRSRPLRQFGPVEKFRLCRDAKKTWNFAFRSSLLDVNNASKIGKDGRLGHSSSAEADRG